MGRRKLSSCIMAVVTALMIGLREGTGLAPTPPLVVSEEVHWLSPGLDNEPDFDFSLAPMMESEDSDRGEWQASSRPRELTGSFWSVLARLWGPPAALVLSSSSAAS